ncbi:MAG: hypothetical protein IKQ40_00315, partial [Lachnospiraceae bacterium]|nr:hypothetical protein [Lachnospiraceae bacterium]
MEKGTKKDKLRLPAWMAVFTALAATVFLALMPQNAKAVYAGTNKSAENTMIGTKGIQPPEEPADINTAWKGSYVYFGIYENVQTNVTSPVKYRVLDPETTVFTNAKSPTMFLDCDSVLINQKAWNNTGGEGANVWSNSSLRDELNNETGDEAYLNKCFTSGEKNAIAYSSAQTREFKENLKDILSGFSGYTPITNDRIFLLDVEDSVNPDYGYYPQTAAYDAANHTKSSGSQWWLRTPKNSLFSKNVAYYSWGSLYDDGSPLSNSAGMSPAMNVSLSSVVFASAVSDNAEYTLTLSDDSVTATIDTDNIGNDNGTISVPYSNVENCTRLAVLITDKEYKQGNPNDATIKKYESLAVDEGGLGTSGTGIFTLPDDFTAGDYVYIIPENVVDGNYSDYAGAFTEIEIPFPNTVTVSADPVKGGSATVALSGKTPSDKVSAPKDTVVALSAKAEKNWHFVEWKADGPGSISDTKDPDATFTVGDGDTEITANFEEDPQNLEYTVTLDADPENGGTVTPESSSGVKGTKVSIEAAPADNFEFVEWKVSGPGTISDKKSLKTKFTIGEGDAEIIAIFERIPEYTVSVSADPEKGGSVKPTSATGAKGKKITLEATASKNYVFKEWKVKGPGTISDKKSKKTEFTIGEGNAEVTAVFKAKEYTVEVSADPEKGGTVTVTVSDKTGTSVKGQSGKKATIKAKAGNGYTF